MIDLTIPPGRAPDALVSEALVAVFDEVADTRDTPHELDAAVAGVRRRMVGNDVVALDQALRESAAAHVAAIVRLRAEYPDLGGV